MKKPYESDVNKIGLKDVLLECQANISQLTTAMLEAYGMGGRYPCLADAKEAIKPLFEAYKAYASDNSKADCIPMLMDAGYTQADFNYWGDDQEFTTMRLENIGETYRYKGCERQESLWAIVIERRKVIDGWGMIPTCQQLRTGLKASARASAHFRAAGCKVKCYRMPISQEVSDDGQPIAFFKEVFDAEYHGIKITGSDSFVAVSDDGITFHFEGEITAQGRKPITRIPSAPSWVGSPEQTLDYVSNCINSKRRRLESKREKDSLSRKVSMTYLKERFGFCESGVRAVAEIMGLNAGDGSSYHAGFVINWMEVKREQIDLAGFRAERLAFIKHFKGG